MRYLTHTVVSVLDRVQRRMTQSRPGSVLILVIVLVVLLALMGTALLSTTRGDRFVSAQHTANTQIDLLVDGVVQMVKSAMADDLFAILGSPTPKKTYRAPWNTGKVVAPGPDTIGAYGHWDMPNLIVDDPAIPILAANYPQDIWLSPRLPTIAYQGTAPIVYWPSIGMLPGVTQFDAPFACGPNRSIDLSKPTTYTNRVTDQTLRLTPEYVQPRGYSQSFPAWYLGGRGYVVAGDADGDGIADSGYVKIPVGELDGLTYYYAVRVIDNNSAINVNTAWSRISDFDMPGAGTINPTDAFGRPASTTTNNLGMFRSHVGLFELMHPGTLSTGNGTQAFSEMGRINSYRFGNGGAWTDGGSLGFANSGSIVNVTSSGTLARNDFAYITQGDFLEHTLARQIDNPGRRIDSLTGTTLEMKAFGSSDAAGLGYRFSLMNLDSASWIESLFDQSNMGSVPDSIRKGAANNRNNTSNPGTPVRNRKAYRPNEVADWFYDNFSWDMTTQPALSMQTFQSGTLAIVNGTPHTYLPWYRPPLRPILTTYNPVSNIAPIRDITAVPTTPALAPYRPTASTSKVVPKTNINTAPFPELWRAFWSVMAEENGDSPFTGADGGEGRDFESYPTNAPPFNPKGSDNPQRMFRSSLRDEAGAKIPARSMVQLRSAAAAVQAMQMREVAPAGRTKPPYFNAGNTARLAIEGNYELDVIGTTPQPFITEVFVFWDANAAGPLGEINDMPYIAIELYNPFSQPVEIDGDWKIKYWHREAAVPSKTLNDTNITFSNVTLGPDSYLVIDNFDATGYQGKQVRYYPASSNLSGAPAGGQYQQFGNLTAVLDNEMVITRMVKDRNGASVEQPIDSFDFGGFPALADLDTNLGRIWHYVRRNKETNSANGDGRWLCVYPGRYDPSKGASWSEPRHQGTNVSDEWTTGLGGITDPWVGGPPKGAPVTLGAANDKGNIDVAHEFTIPLPDLGSPGPNPLSSGTRAFPFGMFARNGDILQVPFIASYTIYQNGKPVEMNSISMDAAFAEDTDLDDDGDSANPTAMKEQIGRFCPLVIGPNNAPIVNDFDDTGLQPGIDLHRYAWARDLFDYLTVQSPASDYSPNVLPDAWANAGGSQRPDPVKNGAGTGQAAEEDSVSGGNAALVGLEDTVPIHGLININTAPGIVLSAIPWMPPVDMFKFDPTNGQFTVGQNSVDDNIDIGKAIAFWRDGERAQLRVPPGGPFRSIFDLYRVEDSTHVRIFELIQKTLFGSTEPGYAHGEFSSLNDGDVNKTDLVRNDFKEQYLLLTKVSNLLTTRSDSFTVYILVQGWRGVGGSHPEMVVQRRVAFIQDRSSFTAGSSVLQSSTNVPTD